MSQPTETVHRLLTCPECGHLLDASTAIDGSDDQPTKGDLTICLYCAALLVFDDDELNLRVTTASEFERALMENRRLQAAMVVVVRLVNSKQAAT